MHLNKNLYPLLLLISTLSCSGDKKSETKHTETVSNSTKNVEHKNYDINKGLGQYDNIDVSKFDAQMAENGQKIFQMNCISCHNVSDEKLVGPGLKGITTRHSAAWIMNFISNPNEMLNLDPELKQQVETYGIKMPNQNLNPTQVRAILEYLRQIDGAK